MVRAEGRCGDEVVESKIKSAAGFLLRLVSPGIFMRHA